MHLKVASFLATSKIHTTCNIHCILTPLACRVVVGLFPPPQKKNIESLKKFRDLGVEGKYQTLNVFFNSFYVYVDF